MARRITRLLLAVFLLAGLCCGCQGKFTRQRYETIYPTMPDWKVREILGKPDAESQDRWTYLHQCPYYKAVIHFEDSRVKEKSWSNDRFADQEPD